MDDGTDGWKKIHDHDVLYHPSIRPIIHPWMASYREENPGRNK
jgi:hypothetical protein